MLPARDRLRTVFDGSAALVCLLLAGWAIACIQSDRMQTAAIIASVAAAIPVAALLARIPALLTLVVQRPAPDRRAR